MLSVVESVGDGVFGEGRSVPKNRADWLILARTEAITFPPIVDEESMVTPLPCDIRHYFHTACIEQWLMINASCPLCKSAVTPEEIERVAIMYRKKLV